MASEKAADGAGANYVDENRSLYRLSWEIAPAATFQRFQYFRAPLLVSLSRSFNVFATIYLRVWLHNDMGQAIELYTPHREGFHIMLNYHNEGYRAIIPIWEVAIPPLYAPEEWMTYRSSHYSISCSAWNPEDPTFICLPTPRIPTIEMNIPAAAAGTSPDDLDKLKHLGYDWRGAPLGMDW